MTRPPSRYRLLAAFSVALALAACASKEPAAPAIPAPLPPPTPQEASPQFRAQLHTDLGAGYYERGQMEIAIEELNDAIKLDPNSARPYNILGLIYAVLGEEARAQQNFQRALSLAPQDPEIRQNRGWYLCTHGRAQESIAEFEQAFRNPLYRTPEIPLINAGNCSAAIGELKNADTYFRRALTVSPNNAAATYGLALLAYEDGRLPDARNWMKAMQQTNLPPEALYLGMCIERKLGDRQAEVSYIAQLRNRYPDAAETRAIAGACK
jgi:type IV pilus assembly protein PilF